jgi:hypothetical protein
VSESSSGPKLRRIAAAAALAALIGALFVTVTSAHKRSYDSTLQLRIAPVDAATSLYSGRVNSDRAKCESGRTVTVAVGGSVIVGATTAPGGTWSAVGPSQPKGTTVTATMPRKFLKRSKKHKHKCTSDFVERKAK